MKTIYICRLSSGSTVLSSSKTTSTNRYSLTITEAKRLQKAYGNDEGAEVPNEIFDAFAAKAETMEMFVEEKINQKNKLLAAELSSKAETTKLLWWGNECLEAYLKGDIEKSGKYETIIVFGIGAEGGLVGFNSKSKAANPRINEYPISDFLNGETIKKTLEEIQARTAAA